MVIHSAGYAPPSRVQQNTGKDLEFLLRSFPLIWEQQEAILRQPELFEIQLDFAWCSWPYLDGDGPLCLGYLILGWQNGILQEPCSQCDSLLFITSFGGSPISGRNGWRGICLQCRQFFKGKSANFVERMQFVMRLRQECKASKK